MKAGLFERSEALHARVRRFIHDPRAEGFEDLALEIAAFQREAVEPVERLSRALRGDQPPRDLHAIAALPTDVFRHRRVAAHPAELDVRVFSTSGTTGGEAGRGRHALRTLETYEAAALAHGRAMFWPAGAASAIVLAPRASDAPDSSLSFMIDLFIERWQLRSAHVLAGEGVDLPRTIAAASAARAPVLAMGTAFAWVHLLDGLGEGITPLPRGSRAMLTGGFKGRSREVSEPELRAGIAGALAIDPSDVVGEYGMTELSSQLWERSGGVYHPPAWLRVDAVDPETLEVLPRGAEGIARFLDLANVDSSIGVQTQDRVIVAPNGDVTLLGRLPGAPPRGCSLAIEEILGG